jgi:REP element-mobilizing transposase RayT
MGGFKMRSRYKITAGNGIYFVTSTIIEWLPVFTSKKYFDIIIESLQFCKEKKGLELYAFVILDNHFHLVISGPELSKVLSSLKMYTARKIILQLTEDRKEWLLNQFAYFKKRHKTSSAHQVWQEGSHPQIIMNEQMLVQKIEYTHYNPVKRGLVDLPEHWRYSSARNYSSGDHSILRVDRLPV